MKITMFIVYNIYTTLFNDTDQWVSLPVYISSFQRFIALYARRNPHNWENSYKNTNKNVCGMRVMFKNIQKLNAVNVARIKYCTACILLIVETHFFHPKLVFFNYINTKMVKLHCLYNIPIQLIQLHNVFPLFTLTFAFHFYIQHCFTSLNHAREIFLIYSISRLFNKHLL